MTTDAEARREAQMREFSKDWTARLITLPHECCAPPACIRCGKPTTDGIPMSHLIRDTAGWHGVICPRCIDYPDTPICSDCGGDHASTIHNEGPEEGALG